MADDTPRSVGSTGPSPRDDRFYTPRTVARENSLTASSDEWYSPRHESPRYDSPRFETPRYGYNSQSDGEFQTPRTYDADSKMGSRLNQLRGSGAGSASYKDEKNGRSISRDAAMRSNDNSSAQSKPPVYARNGQNGSNGSAIQPGYDAESNPYSHLGGGDESYKSGPLTNEHKSSSRRYSADDEAAALEDEIDYIALDLAAAGLSEHDVEDVFSYARHGRVEEIDRLFNKGLPVDVRDAFGNTVLTIACQNGNKRVAKAVLRRGANINTRNHKGNTPLHYCYHYGYGDTLGQYIVSKGADPEARNNAGKLVWEGI